MDWYSKFYCWTMQMKLRMGIYALAVILCKMAWNALDGVYVVEIVELLEMWLAAMAFAIVEALLLPTGQEHPAGRVALWALAGNIIFLGGSLVLGWFAGMPVWGGVVLTVLLELGLGAMWYGDRLMMQMDSARLNRQLREFQNRQACQTESAE